MQLVRKMTHLNALKLDGSAGSSSEPVDNIIGLVSVNANHSKND